MTLKYTLYTTVQNVSSFFFFSKEINTFEEMYISVSYKLIKF